MKWDSSIHSISHISFFWLVTGPIVKGQEGGKYVGVPVGWRGLLRYGEDRAPHLHPKWLSAPSLFLSDLASRPRGQSEILTQGNIGIMVFLVS